MEQVEAAAPVGELAALAASTISILLANAPCLLGDLIDFVNEVPPDAIGAMAASLAAMVFSSSYSSDVRRRHLVMLGALINKLIFEVEAIPARRDHKL